MPFFSSLVHMTLTGSVVIAVLLLVRLILRRAPRTFLYALWLAALFRLLCPATLSSPLSLFNTAPIQQAERLESAVSQQFSEQNTQIISFGVSENGKSPTAPKGSAPQLTTLLPQLIWAAGVLVLFVYGFCADIRLRHTLAGAVKLKDNIYLADAIPSPFVRGILRPKIYLPSTLPDKDRDCILAHERHHIRRLDPLFRLLGYAALCLHWFNPLVWLAFYLSGRDMEMSCDEAVIRALGPQSRAAYSETLLSFSIQRRFLPGMPLAFGEGDTGRRIRNLARWKKPIIWVSVCAAVLCAVLAVCLLTDAKHAPAAEQHEKALHYMLEGLYPPLTLKEAAEEAYTIVYGEIGDFAQARVITDYAPNPFSECYTIRMISVSEPLKGTENSTIPLLIPGGETDTEIYIADYAPAVQPGDRVVAFIGPNDIPIRPQYVFVEKDGKVYVPLDSSDGEWGWLETEAFLAKIRDDLG